MFLCQIKRTLRDHNSLIVHFSGTPRGIGAGQPRPDFPLDLQNVIKNSASWEIPCSTVSDGVTRASNGTMGSIGLIIRCKNGASLLGVCSHDAGSYYDHVSGKRNLGSCVAPSATNCVDSIVNRHGHNEWIITNYEAAGVLVDDTFAVWDSNTNFERSSDIHEIFSAFPNLPILYFYKGDLWEIYPTRNKRNIDDFI